MTTTGRLMELLKVARLCVLRVVNILHVLVLQSGSRFGVFLLVSSVVVCSGSFFILDRVHVLSLEQL